MKRFISASYSVILVLIPTVSYGATVEGTIHLDGQSDHSGISVSITESLAVPALYGPGILILLIAAGYFIVRKQKIPAFFTLILMMTILVIAPIFAAALQTTQTDVNGLYTFYDVEPGRYRLTAEKTCYVAETIDPVTVQDEVVHPPDLLLTHLSDFNESLMPVNMKRIIQAEIDYNNSSAPHTFTGNLSCLVSGNGAGGEGLLDIDFADGVIDGYQVVMGCSDPDVNGSVWSWSATAFPLTYQCSGRLTYYADEARGCPGCMVQAEDIAGAPGNTTLPFVCEGEQPLLAHLSMQAVTRAETDYNNNSSPHTYTGDITCLVSGNGAGQIRLLCRELQDSEMCNYTYSLIVCAPDSNGSRWAWSCTAWPVIYGGDSLLTFYVDETAVVRAGDTGGFPGDGSLPDAGHEPDTCF